jgi:hypothetical protein
MKTIEIHTINPTEAVMLANKQRLLSKNEWIEFHFVELGAIVKNYGTWMQIMQKGGRRDSSPMDQSVKDWKDALGAFLSN